MRLKSTASAGDDEERHHGVRVDVVDSVHEQAAHAAPAEDRFR